MEAIRLDAERLLGREEAMEQLGRALALPEWWGRNLDALHDCLTQLGRPVRLELGRREALEGTDFGRTLAGGCCGCWRTRRRKIPIWN